jgi:hypothetical protein
MPANIDVFKQLDRAVFRQLDTAVFRKQKHAALQYANLQVIVWLHNYHCGQKMFAAENTGKTAKFHRQPLNFQNCKVPPSTAQFPKLHNSTVNRSISKTLHVLPYF